MREECIVSILELRDWWPCDREDCASVKRWTTSSSLSVVVWRVWWSGMAGKGRSDQFDTYLKKEKDKEAKYKGKFWNNILFRIYGA